MDTFTNFCFQTFPLGNIMRRLKTLTYAKFCNRFEGYLKSLALSKNFFSIGVIGDAGAWLGPQNFGPYGGYRESAAKNISSRMVMRSPARGQAGTGSAGGDLGRQSRATAGGPLGPQARQGTRAPGTGGAWTAAGSHRARG